MRQAAQVLEEAVALLAETGDATGDETSAVTTTHNVFLALTGGVDSEPQTLSRYRVLWGTAPNSWPSTAPPNSRILTRSCCGSCRRGLPRSTS